MSNKTVPTADKHGKTTHRLSSATELDCFFFIIIIMNKPSFTTTMTYMAVRAMHTNTTGSSTTGSISITTDQ